MTQNKPYIQQIIDEKQTYAISISKPPPYTLDETGKPYTQPITADEYKYTQSVSASPLIKPAKGPLYVEQQKNGEYATGIIDQENISYIQTEQSSQDYIKTTQQEGNDYTTTLIGAEYVKSLNE